MWGWCLQKREFGQARPEHSTSGIGFGTHGRQTLSLPRETRLKDFLSANLHWIRGAGDYKQFVSNRVSKIQQHSDVKWRHVTCQETPEYLGRRGGSVQGENLWRNGPTEWLTERENWP